MKSKTIIRYIALIAVAIILCNQFTYSIPVKKKVACVGNSITYGAGLASPATQSYPPQMQILLGSGYQVLNFGVSSRTMLKNGDYPFWNDVQYTNALAFNPDYVIIKLGTNDSKTFQWPKLKNEYPLDYKDMIKSFQSLPSHPQVIMCMLVPGQNEGWQIWDSVMRDEVNPVIKQIALDEGLPLIDLYTVFENGSPNWILPDGVHPTEAGSAVIAEQVKNMITLVRPTISFDGNKLIAPDGDGYQWYRNGKPIAAIDGGTLKDLVSPASGKYKVSVKLASGSETRVVSEEYNLNFLSGEYRITGKHSLKNIGIEGKSLDYGARIVQFNSDTSKNQIWNIIKSDSVYYELVNQNSQNYMTIEHSSMLAGANIAQSGPNESDTVLWEIIHVENGLYAFVNKATKYALTVLNNSDTAGAGLIQDTLKYTDNQLFMIHSNQLTQEPFYGTPFEVPSIFEAEDFDLGGEGLAYHTIGSYIPGEYRPDEGISVSGCNNCSFYAVSDLAEGEWIEYSINVTDTNELIYDFRMSSEVNDSKMQIFIDGVDKTGSVTFPVTGNYDTWTSSIFPMKISLGNHILRVACTQGSFNLDKIAVAKNFEGNYLITLNSNGKVLSVADNQTAEDASVVQYTPTGEGGQQWSVLYGRDGYYKLENINSSKTLTSVQDTIVQKDFTDSDNQLWQFVTNGKGYYNIRNLGTGNFLQPSEMSSTNGIIMITKSMTSDGNLMYSLSKIPGERQPFKGTRINLPGIIEAEDYDLGGEGTAYHELDGLYSLDLYRKLETVDLENCVDGGYDVNNIKANEWLTYSVYADSTIDYKFDFKTSRSKAIIRIGVDDIDSVTTITVPSTGSAQVWKTESVIIPLTKGNHLIKTLFTVGNINIDKITVTYNNSVGIEDEIGQSFHVYPNPVSEGFVTIQLPSDAGYSNELTVTDISGKIIYKKQHCESTERIDFSGYPTGLYFVKFNNKDQTYSGRIIKK